MKLVMDVLTPGLQWEDIERERSIARAAECMVGSRTAEARQYWGIQHRYLIRTRSAVAVEAMERAQGLAAGV